MKAMNRTFTLQQFLMPYLLIGFQAFAIGGFDDEFIERQGPLVEIPAEVGSLIGVTIGAIVGLPFGIFQKDQSGFNTIRPAYKAGKAGADIGATIMGFPFYLIKIVIIDFPTKLFRSGNPDVELNSGPDG